MQIIELSPMWTVLADILAWAFFHLSISYGMMNVPLSFFQERKNWFNSASWERNGLIWQELLHIQKWKNYLPDGTMVWKQGYNKSQLPGSDQEALERFLLETMRAELTHWISILPAGLFFLWNPPWAGWIMIAYAVLFNLPFIVTQRYNRPRLERVYQKKKQQTTFEQ